MSTTETYAVTVRIPLASGASAEATFTGDNGHELSYARAMDIRKLLKSCDGEIYVNISKTTVDSDFKP